jgi:hypothetical protein
MSYPPACECPDVHCCGGVTPALMTYFVCRQTCVETVSRSTELLELSLRSSVDRHFLADVSQPYLRSGLMAVGNFQCQVRTTRISHPCTRKIPWSSALSSTQFQKRQLHAPLYTSPFWISIQTRCAESHWTFSRTNFTVVEKYQMTFSFITIKVIYLFDNDKNKRSE